MGSFSMWHWLIVLAIVLLLFGRGKIPELMGDVAKGIKNFKKGLKDDDETRGISRSQRAIEQRHAGAHVRTVVDRRLCRPVCCQLLQFRQSGADSEGGKVERRGRVRHAGK